MHPRHRVTNRFIAELIVGKCDETIFTTEKIVRAACHRTRSFFLPKHRRQFSLSRTVARRAKCFHAELTESSSGSVHVVGPEF